MQIPLCKHFGRAALFIAAFSGFGSTYVSAQAQHHCDDTLSGRDTISNDSSSRICDNLGVGIFEACEVPVVSPSDAPSQPLEFFPSPMATPEPMASAPPTPLQSAPMQPATPSGGGFGDLNLISGSSPGESFAAALAPGTYMDSAPVGNMFRTRFDAAYGNPLPDRAEFFYAQCGILSAQARGPNQIETNVDYQELTPYLETALTNKFSFFIETPMRFINPDVNDNTSGMGDLNTGFKRALYACNGQFLTAQFRIYAPTGDADRGLGTGHASLEPGLLYLGQWSDRLAIQSEFRVWVPLSDAQVTGRGNFAGTVLRYGLGGGYDLLNLDTRCQRRRLTGTFETVAWTITDGLALDGNSQAADQVIDVSGDTIVNLKTGLRYTSGRNSLAGSYGFAVSNERWYSDIMRFEYRYAF
ncbi:MAG: hypothetical protein R3C53_04450 [Pirellulaceae bacterium]